MASRAVAMEATDERTERYRRAERALWSHYGLEPSERFVEIESPAVRLRIQEVGSGEPIVFVHGGLWPAVALAPLVRELPGYRCILLDRPGCGLSSPVDWRKHEIWTVATTVMGGVVDALRLEQTHVIGHSIGGVWALRLAQGHPSRVGRIGILGASPVLAEMPRPGFFRILASPIGALITRLPQNQDRARSMLRQDGHGPSLDAGRIPDVFFDWHVALVRNTETLRNERAMIRDAVIRRRRVASRAHLRARRAGRDPAAAPLRRSAVPIPRARVDYAKQVVGGAAQRRAECPTQTAATCPGSTMRPTSATRSAPSSTTRPG